VPCRSISHRYKSHRNISYRSISHRQRCRRSIRLSPCVCSLGQRNIIRCALPVNFLGVSRKFFSTDFFFGPNCWLMQPTPTDPKKAYILLRQKAGRNGAAVVPLSLFSHSFGEDTSKNHGSQSKGVHNSEYWPLLGFGLVYLPVSHFSVDTTTLRLAFYQKIDQF
jgi:hypothetical protein